MKSKLEKSNVEYCKFLNTNIYNHYPDILSTEKIIELIKLFPSYESFIPQEIILGIDNKYDSDSYRKYFSHYMYNANTAYINKNIYTDDNSLFNYYEDRYPIIADLLYQILFSSKLRRLNTNITSGEIASNASKFMNDNKKAIDKILGINNIIYEIDEGTIALSTI